MITKKLPKTIDNEPNEGFKNNSEENSAERHYQEKTLDSILPLLSEPDCLILGHGTGRSIESKEIIDSIFENGLRTKDDTVINTSIGFSVDPNKLKEFQDKLDNWTHMDSKKIILARLPYRYMNKKGDKFDQGGLTLGAFYDKKNIDGKETNYLSPKFIIGCYDVDRKVVEINPLFEPELSESSQQEVKEKYDKTVKEYEQFLKSRDEMLEGGPMHLTSIGNVVHTNTNTSDSMPLYDYKIPEQNSESSENDEEW